MEAQRDSLSLITLPPFMGLVQPRLAWAATRGTMPSTNVEKMTFIPMERDDMGTRFAWWRQIRNCGADRWGCEGWRRRGVVVGAGARLLAWLRRSGHANGIPGRVVAVVGGHKADVVERQAGGVKHVGLVGLGEAEAQGEAGGAGHCACVEPVVARGRGGGLMALGDHRVGPR